MVVNTQQSFTILTAGRLRVFYIFSSYKINKFHSSHLLRRNGIASAVPGTKLAVLGTRHTYCEYVRRNSMPRCVLQAWSACFIKPSTWYTGYTLYYALSWSDCVLRCYTISSRTPADIKIFSSIYLKSYLRCFLRERK